MSLDTKVKNLIINTNMTKEQYEAIDDKSNQLFFVEDSSVVDVPAPEENQSGYLHTDGTNLTWKEIESGDKLPDQTDNAGKFLTTDGTTASWSDKPLVNKVSDPSSIEDTSVIIYGTPSESWCSTVIGAGASSNNGYGTVVGYKAKAGAQGVAVGVMADSGNGISIGCESSSDGAANGIAIGNKATANGDYSIVLGHYVNTDENNSFVVGLGWDGVNSRYANYKLLDFDGTIPTDRYTITPTDAGTYIPKLTIAEDGTTTREWGAESGGESLPDQTDNAGKFLTTDGTTASWGEALTNNSTKLFATAVGSFSSATAGGSAFGYSAIAGYTNSVAIGYSAKAQATNAIQLGQGTNSDEQTFKVANANGNFEIMDVQGNIPLDRLTYVTDQIGDISTALTSILGE